MTSKTLETVVVAVILILIALTAYSHLSPLVTKQLQKANTVEKSKISLAVRR